MSDKKKTENPKKTSAKVAEIPEVAKDKPTEKPPVAESMPQPETEKEPEKKSPDVKTSGTVEPLDPGETPKRVPEPAAPEPKNKGGRPRKSHADRIAERAERVAAKKAAEEEKKRQLESQIDASTHAVVATIGMLFSSVLPPPLTEGERTALFEAYRPLLAQYDGEIPPWATALIVTAAIAGPRVASRISRSKRIASS